MKAGTATAVLSLSLILCGCASTDPIHKEVHGRFASTGRAIQTHLKPAEDDSVKALYEAFDLALAESEKAAK